MSLAINRFYKAFVLMVALSSIMYEFVLAAMLSALFGSVLLHYSLTVGTYMAGMGLGSLCFPVVKKPTKSLFVQLQLVFILLGGGGFLLLMFLSHWQYSLPWLIIGYSYTLIVLIGLVSGLQMPLMQKAFSLPSSQILFYDYLGAFLGSCLFSLFFYPFLGISTTLLFIISCNVAIAFCMSLINQQRKVILFLLMAILMLAIVWSSISRYDDFIRSIYLGS